jgi:hypothetical protein
MPTALIAGLLGILGTFVGAMLTTWTARQTTDRSERRIREEARRQEYRSAVIRFATELMTYRLAEMDLWFALHDETKDKKEAAGKVYGTRAVVWNAFYELELTTDTKIARLARRGIDSATSIHSADSRDAMDRCTYQTRRDLAELIEAAREAQPGTLPVSSGNRLTTP